MKQITYIVCLLVVFAASTTVVSAQKRMYFGSGDTGGNACVTALQNGTASFYRPTYFGLHRKLRAGEEIRGLEADACVYMLTVKGNQWVAQKEGEKFIFKGQEIVAREDCGNPAPDIRYPKTAVAENVPPQTTPSPTPTPTPAPKCPEGTEASETPGICIEKVPGPTEYINPCPTNVSWENETSFKARVAGQWWQKLGSFGASMAISKARGSDWGDAAIDGGKGVALQAGQQLVNASEDITYLTVADWGINRAKIKKGKRADLGRGVTVEWSNGHANLFVVNNGKKFRCDGQGLKEASNLGIWTDGKDVVQTITQQGPKTQPKPPVRPSQPSTGVAGGTRPSRPTIGNPLTNQVRTQPTPVQTTVRRGKTQIM